MISGFSIRVLFVETVKSRISHALVLEYGRPRSYPSQTPVFCVDYASWVGYLRVLVSKGGHLTCQPSLPVLWVV